MKEISELITSTFQSSFFSHKDQEKNINLDFLNSSINNKFIQMKKDDIFIFVEKAVDKRKAGKVSNFDYLVKLGFLS